MDFPAQPPMAAVDLYKMKLVAFYASQYSWFLAEYGSRYRFTQKGHSMHPFFAALVKQYKLLAKDKPPTDVIAAVKELTKSNEQKAESEEKAKAKEDRERLAFAQVDWQDFTVLQEISFSARDLQDDLPLPISKQDVQNTAVESRGEIIDSMQKNGSVVVSPFTGEHILASEYDAHVKIMTRAEQKPKQDADSNLYYDDAEANLRQWKKPRTNG